jgi:Peptidase A4 family
MLRRLRIPFAAAIAVGALLGMATSATAATTTHGTAAAAHTLSLPRGVTPGGLMHRPAGALKSHARGVVGEAESTNWSGYAVTGGDGAFSSVSASWKQPTASCTSRRSDTYAAFWVGLDGYSSDSVEQTGTLIECVGTTAEYFGWYEMYPAGLVTYSSTVRPGDSFSASVTFSGSDTYTLVLKDSTEGWTQTKVVNQSGLDRSSAEVITEAPCCTSSGGILPLADFGTVSYTGSADNGSSMGTQSPTEIVMIDNSGQDKDTTSAISSSGAFSNTWVRSN